MWELSKAVTDPTEQTNGSSVGEDLPWPSDGAVDAPVSQPGDGIERAGRVFAIAGISACGDEADQQSAEIAVWSADEISDYLWAAAEEQVEELQASVEQALAIWGESVIEKAEKHQSRGATCSPFQQSGTTEAHQAGDRSLCPVSTGCRC